MRRMLAVLLVMAGWAGVAQADKGDFQGPIRIVTRSQADGELIATARCFALIGDVHAGFACPSNFTYQWYLQTCTTAAPCTTKLLNVTKGSVKLSGLRSGTTYVLYMSHVGGAQRDTTLYRR
jgi:hypothetical protein